MKRTEKDDLLKDLLSGDELAEFRQASLERGLKALAARRTRRQILRACAGCSLLLALVAVLSPWLPGHSRRNSVASAPSDAAAPAPSHTCEIKFISDDELMALFPNRPIALIGKPGHQQFVFLDTHR